MKKSKIIEFARKNGYDSVLPLGRWKEYDCYEPIFTGATEEDPSLVGPPLIILVKDDEIRMSTEDEAYEQMEDADEDEDDIEKFNPYHDSRGRFTTAGSAASFTYKPGQGAAYDNAIAREKERHAGGGSSAEQETPRMKTIHSIEDNIRNQMYETAAVVDKDGNVVFQKPGQASQVGFTQMECFMMRNNTLTHNHPRSSMFSMEDTLCFVKNDMEEIRATTREGTTYSIKRGAGYNRNKGIDFVSDYDKAYKKACSYAQDDLDKRGFRDRIFDGSITQAQANREFGRVVTNVMINHCTANASKFGIDFSVEKRAVSGQRAIDAFGKSADKSDGYFVLDDETNAYEAASFEEWLNRSDEPAKKSYTILKADEDKRLVFGWASVSISVDGEQLEDVQEDMIDPEDLEEAAYEYVLNFRDTGEEHIPTMRMKGKLVESCVFTAEKQQAMGIPDGILPIGWWVGFKIEDDAAWERVKNGTYRMFSIEGRANRVPVEKARRDYDEYPSFSMWLEENLDATREEQKAAKKYYETHKEEAKRNWKYAPPSVAKSFNEILERSK